MIRETRRYGMQIGMSQMTFFYDNPEIADKYGWLFVELNYMMV